MTVRIWAAALATMALATPAMAASNGGAGPMVSGFVDFGAGGGTGEEWGNYFNSYGWNETNLHGAAKLAIRFAPGFLTQFDVSAVNLNGSQSGSGYNYNELSAAAHLALTPSPNGLIGLMASVGQDGSADDPAATIGVDFAHWMGKFRFYGQAGYVQGSGSSDEEGYSATYIESVLTYYSTPNLAVSAILGFDHDHSSTAGYSTNEVDWGARAEFKTAGAPASLYVSYQGYYASGSFPGDFDFASVGHRLIAGVRIPFGNSSLQDLDQQVGLGDLNPVYGDIPH